MQLRDIKSKRKTRDRAWQLRKNKVPPRIARDFPWEIVVRFLQRHPRSLILLQMVDRNLRQVLRADNSLWATVYSHHFFHRSYLSHRVRDPAFQALTLYKQSANSVAYHVGPVPGKTYPPTVSPASIPDPEVFADYVRRWLALLYGTRCGLCGCRFRHDIYWSLRMRVCHLCMAHNTISADALLDKYGLAHGEILTDIAGKVFYYQLRVSLTEDRAEFHGVRRKDLMERRQPYMFWLPHLRQIYDLEALRQGQRDRKAAAARLCAQWKRIWVFRQRVAFAAEGQRRRSIDCLLISLYQNEKRRLLRPYRAAWCCSGLASNAVDWAFPDKSFCGTPRHYARTRETASALVRRMVEWEDRCPTASAVVLPAA